LPFPIIAGTSRKCGAKPDNNNQKSFASFLQKRRFFFLESKKQRWHGHVSAVAAGIPVDLRAL
jgi:hypothetical protein